MKMDWSVGHYEATATQLLPAAEVVVERAAPGPGERVVDVGCGTGNAALLAAARGARVTGVDPAQRLLEVARKQAAAEGVDATFMEGDASALPLGDASAEIVMSVFGVIFADNPLAAGAEMARVTVPRGRIFLTAWMPRGPIVDCVGVFQDAVRRALSAPPAPPGFAWHDEKALAGLLGPHGFTVTVSQEALTYTAPSARAWLNGESENHPLSVAGRAVLERSGDAEAAFERALGVLEAANETPQSFRVTSRYVVAAAQRR
jgi:SAM-dependent methyltransferase